MDTIKLILHPSYREDVSVVLQTENEQSFSDIPTGKEIVYNDNSYYFSLFGTSEIPSKIYINDEIYEVEQYFTHTEEFCFKLKKNDMPFLNCYGSVKIELEINAQSYYTRSITVMVSNTTINNNVTNMIDYIYNNCEHYLYEEHKYSNILTGIKESGMTSLEAKIKFLEEKIEIFKKSYQYLKTNPYSKIIKTENVDSFEKLQVISQNTVQYIVNHTDELTAVNYNTGIRFNKQYYQPNRVLVEYNSPTYDVYENRIIVGFLKTIIYNIIDDIKMLQKYVYNPSRVRVPEGYINSLDQIFSRSIKRIKNNIDRLKRLQMHYQELYFSYSKLLKISPDSIRTLPNFTPVFRSISAYRQIYQVIHDWFSIGNYDIGKDELILSFISTSKIYEYYCLVKILCYLEKRTELKETRHVLYSLRHPNDSNTKYNNTFLFEKDDIRITLFFQPVIYGSGYVTNGIYLFRNTSSNSKVGDSSKGGKIYTPDYIIKIEHNRKIYYILMDAKFATTKNIRIHQLQELVYKYLFSISTLNPTDKLYGLYILSGKTSGNDRRDVVHDLAENLHKEVTPFAEILVIGGTDTNDDSIISNIFDDII